MPTHDKRTLERVLNLDVGEKTIVHLPDRDITHHHIRRTEDGFETCTTLTDWRPLSEEEIRDELGPTQP